MNIGDIVLVDITELGTNFIIHKYSDEHARILKLNGHIDFDVPENSTDDGIVFGDSDENSSSDDSEIDNNKIPPQPVYNLPTGDTSSEESEPEEDIDIDKI